MVKSPSSCCWTTWKGFRNPGTSAVTLGAAILTSRLDKDDRYDPVPGLPPGYQAMPPVMDDPLPVLVLLFEELHRRQGIYITADLGHVDKVGVGCLNGVSIDELSHRRQYLGRRYRHHGHHAADLDRLELLLLRPRVLAVGVVVPGYRAFVVGGA